jgi:DNA invertase Pin-like site-specific DNA recombinase
VSTTEQTTENQVQEIVEAEGKLVGRPSALSTKQQQEVRARLGAGESVVALARDYGTSRQTVMRVRAALADAGAPGA